MKILLFIEQKDINNYFELIGEKYYDFFQNLLNIFIKIL